LIPFYHDCNIKAATRVGASGSFPPHLKYVISHFMFGPHVAAYIQYCIKNVAPLVVFPPLLRNPGDGPVQYPGGNAPHVRHLHHHNLKEKIQMRM